MTATGLALAAAAAWGVADFVGGLRARNFPGLIVVLVSQGAAGVILISIAFGAGAVDISSSLARTALLAGLFGGVGLAVLYHALAIGPMSLVAPVAATGVVVPVIAGALTGDHPSALQIGGMAAAGFGTVAASRAPTPDKANPGTTRRGLGLAAVAALLAGSALAALGHAADEHVVGAVVAARVVSITVLGCLALALRPPAPGLPRALPGLVGLGILDTAATLCFAVASNHGLLGVASVTAGLYPVFTIFLARALLAERISRGQAFGVAVALGGVVCLAAG
jgi:drug/metabolite transporter (DMT)-like permease